MSNKEPISSGKREPMLRDEILGPTRKVDSFEGLLIREAMVNSAKNVRDYYEALIDSGILLTREEHERRLAEAETAAHFRWMDP